MNTRSVPVLNHASVLANGETSYRLLSRSSFADYVARWVLDAMVEFTG